MTPFFLNMEWVGIEIISKGISLSLFFLYFLNVDFKMRCHLFNCKFSNQCGGKNFSLLGVRTK